MRIGSYGWFILVIVAGVLAAHRLGRIGGPLYWRCVAWYARCDFRHSCVGTIDNLAFVAALVVVWGAALLVVRAAERLGFGAATPADWRWWAASALYCLVVCLSFALENGLTAAAEGVGWYAPADIRGAISWVQNHPSNERDLLRLLGPDKVLPEHK